MEVSVKYTIFTLFVLFTVSANSANIGQVFTAQPQIADYQVGERWVWQFKGVTDQGVVRAEGHDVRQVIEDNGVLSVKSQYGAIPVADIVKPETSETPRFKWPLVVGKTWIYENHWMSDDGTTGKTVQNVKILHYKEEAVSAGKFMAYTISYKGKISNSRGYNADSEEIYVYSPEVKNFIKLTQIQDDYRYVEELVEYTKP